MIKKKQTTNTYARLENTLAIAGLAVVLLGIVASLYGAYVNQRFIHDTLGSIYYFRWAILLGGGFAISFLFTKQLASRNRLYDGVFFAFLSVSLFWLWEVVRLVIQKAAGSPEYPLSALVFYGGPLVALALALIVGLALRSSPRFGVRLRQLFIASFLFMQLYVLVTTLASLGQMELSWTTIGSFLLMPLVIIALVYILFDKVKRRFDRLFYATFVGALYSILGMVVWEFSTDPTVTATMTFGGIVTGITLCITALVVWKAQRVIK